MDILVIYCHETNYLQTWQLKTTNIIFIISYSFWGSRICQWLSWWFSSEFLVGYSQAVVRAAVIWRFDWAWRTHFQVHSCGCWQEPSVPCYMDLSTGQLMTRQLASPRASNLRECNQDRSYTVFYILLSEMISYLFCQILLITQTLAQWKRGLHRGMNTRRWSLQPPWSLGYHGRQE